MTDTAIAAGDTERSTSADITLLDGQSTIVFTNPALSGNEVVTAERTYDGGSNYVPVSNGELCSVHKSEGRLTGPGVFKLNISATNGNRTVYNDT